MTTLSAAELTSLITRVFAPRPADRALLVMVDLPDERRPDTPAWQERRAMAAGWVEALRSNRGEHGLAVDLCVYANVHANNADLPSHGFLVEPDAVPATTEAAADLTATPFDELLSSHALVVAPTELSATAPLKVLARRLGFRAATMPGFAASMIPALRLDYTEVNRRCVLLKGLLDEATGARIVLTADGTPHELHLDLRYRSAHASGGLIPEPGTAGNLPSGESYIVPYEGELADCPTTSRGTLPVQHGDEVVLYRVESNRAVAVITDGPASRAEAAKLRAEPAYGNLAELGLGVLADFGVAPVGQTLLDEKLGLHIAFGRSEHFGGQVGPSAFSSPDKVVHIDWVYLPEIQPRIAATRVDLELPGSRLLPLIADGRYLVGF